MSEIEGLLVSGKKPAFGKMVTEKASFGHFY
jgi:hypothetical protein